MTSTMAPARALRQRLLAELQEARARTLLLVAPLTDEELHGSARSADEPDPLGPGSHRALRGAVAHPQPRRARSSSWRCRGCTIRSSIRGAPVARCRCPGWPGPRGHGRDPRAASSTGCESADFDADRTAAARRVRVPHGAPARVPAQRDHPPDAPAQAGHALLAARPRRAARRREPVCPSTRHGALSRRAGRDRHRRPHRGVRQRAAAARGGRARRSEIDAHPVTNGEYLEFIEAGGYARPELWSDAGWTLARGVPGARRRSTGPGAPTAG